MNYYNCWKTKNNIIIFLFFLFFYYWIKNVCEFFEWTIQRVFSQAQFVNILVVGFSFWLLLVWIFASYIIFEGNSS
jgi:hypothetical protein